MGNILEHFFLVAYSVILHRFINSWRYVSLNDIGRMIWEEVVLGYFKVLPPAIVWLA
jgi:hypothetical protein